MLLAGDWVVTMAGPPIREGAVRIRGSRVAAVGTRDDLVAAYPDDPLHDFEGCTIVPGLVNAHTHLALTCLKGLIPSQPFPEWLRHMPNAFGALSPDDLAASSAHGAILSVASGVTCVGDIAYGPESVAIAADSGLGGTFYWEVLGTTRDALPEKLYSLEFPSDPARVCQGRLQCGISPHSPYTSGPDLLRATHTIATSQCAQYAIHLAESDAEMQLMEDGTGPLADLAERLADGFEPPTTGSVSYLDELGALDGATAIHCTKVRSVELTALARRARGVVVCPRSNAYLENGVAPVRRMLDAGIVLGIGTDSLASNSDLDLFAEARALRDAAPDVDPTEILAMMTSGGARAIGLGAEFGAIEEGKQGDVAVFRTSGDDPIAALLDEAGRSAAVAVVSGGVFRVIDGGPVFAVSPVERASHMARQKASLALAEGGSGYL